MLLESRVAIVTGGSSGIGRGICLELAKEGCHITVADLDETPRRGKYHDTDVITPTVQEAEKLGKKGLFVQADIGDEANI